MSINPDGFFLIEHIFISVPLYYNWVLFAAVMVALFSFALIFIMQRKIVKGKNELGFRTGIMESANKMLGELLEERKRTELSLKESEAKYRLLVENQSDLIVKVDVKGKFLFVSPSYCRLFGKNQDELLGKTFLPLVHPDDRESTEEAMKQLYQPPWTCQLEQRALTVEGWKWLAWTDTAMLNDEGDVVAIIGTGRDITAQKEAELALRESENRWLMALDGTGDGVWDWNIIDNELFFSPNWKKMLGYETHEVGSTYQSWERLVHPADLEKAVHLLQLHIDGQSEKYFAEYRMLTKEGSWKWVLDRGKVVEFNPEGKPIRMTGTHTDITDFKINQEELQKQNVFIYTILDNLPIGVAVNYFDSGKASYMNETFAKIYGWEANLLTDTEKFFECVYPDPAYRKKMIERVVSDMNSGDPALMRWDEVEIATQRGEKRYVSAWNIPLPEQNVMISTVRDVTSKVLDHKQMLQHQNMLRYIIRHDPSAIAVFDTDMSYLFVSQRYAQDYRIEDPDIIGKNHYEVFPEISENWRNIHQRAMQGEVLQKKEDKFPRADGSVDYTSWECRPWYKNQEIIGGIVIYTEVITERKKAELNLHEQRDK